MRQRFSRLIILATTPLFLLCFIPQSVWSQITQTPAPATLMDQVVQRAEANDQDGLQEAYYDIIEAIESSDDPVAASRAFLESFVAEANARTGGSLTVEGVLQTVKDHLNVFQVPVAKQATVGQSIEMLKNQTASDWNEVIVGKNHDHPHRHHHKGWIPILIISIAVLTAAVCPAAALMAVEGALGIGFSF